MTEAKSTTIEEFLNQVTYDIPADYVPSAFAQKMVIFIKLVNGSDGEENKTPITHYWMLDTLVSGKRRIANLCHRGLAKALSLDTKIPTPNGWNTISGLKVGDVIFDEHGAPTEVLGKSGVFNKPMYKLVLGDGRELKVSEDHINTVVHRRQKRVDGKRVNYLDRRDLTTKELLDIKLTASRSKTLKNPKGKENRVWVPLPTAVQYPEVKLPIDPYTLGLVIGDGAMDRATGYVRLHGHVDDIPYLIKHIPTEVGGVKYENHESNVARVALFELGKAIKKLGLDCHGESKFVPEVYKTGSITQRLEILQGLMDTDGTAYTNGGCAFCSNSEQLAKDVQELVFSLGGSARITRTGEAYRVAIKSNFDLFKLPRKLERQGRNSLDRVPLVAIERIADEPSQCIRVASEESTFLAGDYVVTHNTTIFGEYLILYIAVYGSIDGFGKVDLGLYVSDSIDNGVKNMRKNLEFRRDNSEFLMEYLPNVRFTDIRWEFNNIDGKTTIFKAYGAKTGVRGTKELGKRPQLAILDDLISDEDAESPTILAKITDTVYKALNYALHTKKNMVVWSGTPFNANDPLYKAVESGAWAVNVYPVCEKFPCTREEFRGSWPDRFDYDYVKTQYDFCMKAGNPEAFNQELMLRIMSDEDRLITENELRWYNRQTLLANKHNFNFYITTDFTTSESREADLSVIMVWAYSSAKQWYLVDGIARQQDITETFNDLFTFVAMYVPLSVGIEVSGQQGGFIPWLQQEMLKRNVFFNFASDKNDNRPGIRPLVKKLSRFLVVVPVIKSGQLLLPEELREDPMVMEVVEEILLASRKGLKARYDDCIDGVSMLSVMKPMMPSQQGGFDLVQRDGIWEFEQETEYTSDLESYMV